jgi:HEAT repeat protein
LAQRAAHTPGVVPLLVTALSDHEIVPNWQHPERPWTQRVTSPGREAARGLVVARAKDALLDAVASGSKQQRRNAAWALAELGAEEAVPIMLERLWNPGFIPALGRLRDERAAQPLVEALGGPRSFEAARALRAMDGVAVEGLKEALAHEKGAVRRRAAEILGRLGARGAGDELLAAARRGNREAAAALLEIPPVDGAAEVFRARLGHTDWRWRRVAIAGMLHIDAAIETETLRELLEDPDVTVRGYAARAAGAQRADEVADALAALRGDRADFVAESAVAALAQMGDPRALPTIRSMWAEGGTSVKRRAAPWLRRIGTDEALRLLARLLAEPGLRELAGRELVKAGEKAIAPICDWLREASDRGALAGKDLFETGQAVGVHLATYGEAAIPVLIDLLEEDWQIQYGAQKGLRRITGQSFEGEWQQRTPKWKQWWRKRRDERNE